MYHAMPQYSVQVGLKEFWRESEKKVEQELSQIPLKDVFAPVTVKEKNPLAHLCS